MLLIKRHSAMLKRGNILALIMFVSACSSSDTRHKANQGFEYVDSELQPALIIGDGMDTPQYNALYYIPELKEGMQDRPLGGDVDIRSPVQILALSPLVRVEEGRDSATIWFNSRQVGDMSTHVWTVLANFLADENIAISKLYNDNTTLDSDWFINTDETDEDSDYQLKQRYKYTLLNATSKTTAGLKVELIDHEEIVDGRSLKTPLSDTERRRYSIQMLNKISLYYEKERATRKNNLTQKDQVAKLRLAFSEQDTPLIILNTAFDDAWDLLPSVLAKLGFSIEDKNKVSASLDVNYDQPSDSYWDKNNITPVTFDEGDYHIQVGALSNNTSLAFFDDDKQPLSASKMSQLFISLKDAVKSLQVK